MQINIEQYPLPTRENLFHKMRFGKLFSKIDLKDAYLQMELDEQSKKLLVINTPFGLFQYQRLPYGIASAPAIFQKYIEQLLQNVDGCANYLDDIIITAPTFEKHLERLEKVLTILKDNGICCKKEKCLFFQKQIVYLGRKISASGILPDEQGVKAIENLKRPQNLKELETFIDKITYYHNFIPRFSTLAAPINKLRRKDVPFHWGKVQERSFNELKSHIIKATELSHYQENLPLLLATDASSYGIGAVLSHIYPDGSEKPIAFASKTLNVHETRYAQIEKEALSIIFGVTKFHQYVYGRKFILITDHKPLVTIFNPAKHLPISTLQRLQRWAITLMAYTFEIKYRKSKENANADALSRLPLGPDPEFDQIENCLNVDEILTTPINADQILKSASRDKVLQKVKYYVLNGWPKRNNDPELSPYYNRKLQLTLQNELLCLQGNGFDFRVVIPVDLQNHILELLHEGHWGTVKMKQLARNIVGGPR